MKPGGKWRLEKQAETFWAHSKLQACKIRTRRTARAADTGSVSLYPNTCSQVWFCLSSLRQTPITPRARGVGAADASRGTQGTLSFLSCSVPKALKSKLWQPWGLSFSFCTRVYPSLLPKRMSESFPTRS